MRGLWIGIVLAIVVVLFGLYGWSLSIQSDVYVFNSRQLRFSLREIRPPSGMDGERTVYWKITTENLTGDTVGVRMKQDLPGITLFYRDRLLNRRQVNTDFFPEQGAAVFRLAMADSAAVHEEWLRRREAEGPSAELRKLERDIKKGPFEYLLIPPGKPTTLYALSRIKPDLLEKYKPDSLHVGRLRTITGLHQLDEASVYRTASIQVRDIEPWTHSK